MSTVRSTTIPPAQLGAYLTQTGTRGGARSAPVPALAALRRAAADQVTATAVAPWPVPMTGEAGEAPAILILKF